MDTALGEVGYIVPPSGAYKRYTAALLKNAPPNRKKNYNCVKNNNEWGGGGRLISILLADVSADLGIKSR